MWLLPALLAALSSAVAETVRKRLVEAMDPWAASFLLLRERRLGVRVAGAAVMLAGLGLLAVAG